MECDESDFNGEYFIYTNDFTLSENEEVEFFEFYHPCSQSCYNLMIKKSKLYICIKVDHFGSMFYGNFLFKGHNV